MQMFDQIKKLFSKKQEIEEESTKIELPSEAKQDLLNALNEFKKEIQDIKKAKSFKSPNTSVLITNIGKIKDKVSKDIHISPIIKEVIDKISIPIQKNNLDSALKAIDKFKERLI
jgi:hypothetical protein